ncbi:MAG: C10 family peptidase, partial [Bacteroidales bacterium]|nr:C10 family peptidase [Bacteroidales bacterium]
MKKHFLILFSALIISSATLVHADDVSIKNAEKVAVSFFYEKVNQFKTVDYNDINITNSFTENRNNEAVYYIFNINNDGFVIVSAEDAAYPVLAYSFETLHYTQNNSPEFEYWMDNYARQITDMKAKNLKADIEAEKTWSHLLTSSPTELKTAKSKSIAPFITTTWGQGKYYNKFTPYDPQAMDDNHCPTGCVATSMAVVMNYYRYPVNGFASKTYNANNAQWGYGDYGYLSADFENTTYDYDQMLPTYDGNSGESCTQVSRLMYHAGVSVSMMYGPDGSGTGMNDAFQALKVYWKFSTSIQIKERAGTIPSQWLSYLTTNLDDKKPIIYAGRDNSPGGGGHAWICDGYQGTDYFHFDWGWEGSDNGYYYINNLNTSNGNYTDDQEALFNIYPKNSYPTHCTGQKDIIGTSGTIVDGSGKFDYQDNNDCTWLIKPPSNDSIENITLKWHAFDTESGQDIVTVYDGSSISDPVLGTYSGNSIPPEVTSTGTEMLVRFVTNSSNGHPGWLATYSTSGPHYCNFMSLTDVSGTIEDGSGAKNYRNKTSCLYFIQPPGATTIDFTLTKFDTEEGYDYL